METKKEIGQLVQKLWQVHTKASSGASPVTSQLRWARLDVTGLAPLHSKLIVTEVEPLDTGGDTHTHTHTHRELSKHVHLPQT